MRPLGSSSVAIILGVPSPTKTAYRSPLSVWAELMGLVPPTPDNDVLKAGRMFELAICSRYADDEQVFLRPGPAYEDTPVIGAEAWMGDRPDRYVHDRAPSIVMAPQDPRCDRLLEAKKTWSFTHGETEADTWGDPGTESVPLAYFFQCHWHILVCGHHAPNLDRCDLAAFCARTEEFRIYTIRRDEKMEAALVARARDWWERYIIGGMQPPVSDGYEATHRTLARLTLPGVTDEMRDPDGTDLALARDIKRLRRQAEDLQAQCSGLEAKLKERIGTSRGIRKIATWSPRRGTTTLDRAKLTRDHPDVARAYEKHGEPTRTFRFEFEEE
jgi:hypothetical protein